MSAATGQIDNAEFLKLRGWREIKNLSHCWVWGSSVARAVQARGRDSVGDGAGKRTGQIEG
jgi:hypothetical protein